MPKWVGFAYAAAAAFGHSGIDGSRKLASQRLSSAELVALVGFLDAFFLSSFVFITGALSLTSIRSMSVQLVSILTVSSLLKVLCGVMYQRALYISPLSVTIPYLAFTPALILLTSFVMIGEIPSSQGIGGVVIVTTGGYLLALEGGKSQPQKRPKAISSPLPEPPPATASLTPSLPQNPPSAVQRPMSVVQRDLSSELEVVGALPAKRRILITEPEIILEMKSESEAEAPTLALEADLLDHGMMSPAVDFSTPEPIPSAQLADRPKPNAGGGATLGKGGGGDDVSMTSWVLRPRAMSRLSDVASRSWSNLGKFSMARIWAIAGPHLSRAAEPLLALRREEGSVLMLGCAGLLSLTNSFDKMGAHAAPSIVVFAALQRVAMAIPSFSYLLITSPKSLLGLVRHFPSLAAISIFEIIAIVCYLKSLDTLLVSYSVATKRTNILLSVMVGKFVFKEKILRKLPYIGLMMVGMLFIVFA